MGNINWFVHNELDPPINKVIADKIKRFLQEVYPISVIVGHSDLW